MTLIVFIVDTTISMAAKNYRGCSTLEAAKSFIFEFIKMRSKDNVSKMTDKFCVITSEEYPRCIKEIKQLNREGALNEQLKVIKAKDRQPFIENIYNAFQYVNLSRQASGIENYAYGRCPFFIDPVVFIALTDGPAADELPANSKLESRNPQDFIKEAYRWDQRFFSVVLRMGAEAAAWPNGGRVDGDNSNIEKLSNLVAGTSFRVVSHRQFTPCCETIQQNIILPGITVKFFCPQIQNLRVNGEADSPETRLKKRLDMRPLTRVYVRAQANNKFSGNWPIPESYWYRRIDGLPPRTAYPVIHFGQEPVASLLHTDFAFEKYELEPSPIVEYMMERFRNSQDEKQCLQIFIHNSGKNEGFGKPFGFLKMMSNGNGVNLFLMPYNYPVLYQLVQDLKTDISVKDKTDWKRRMDSYMDNVPPYYMNNLRKAFAKYRIQGVALLDEGGTRQLYPQNLLNHISSLAAQGRDEKAKMQATLDAAAVQNNNTFQCAHLEARESSREASKEHKVRMEALNAPAKKERRAENSRRDPRNVTPQPVEEELFVDPETLISAEKPQRQHIDVHFAEERIRWTQSTYKNPLNLRRTELVSVLPRMMANLKMLVRDSNIPLLEGGRPGLNLKLHHSEELHNLPVGQMGNYDEYVKAQIDIGMAPLRPLETQAARTHAFGNPFKTDKKNMSIDEVMEGPAENNPAITRDSMKNRRGRPQRRKAGPLAANSLCEWRERRRTISERSSVVSDISYTSDLEMEDLTNEPTTNHTNGFSEPKLNGNGLEKDVVDFLDTCRIDDDVTVPPPKKKKPRTSSLLQNLNETDKREKKKAVQEFVRTGSNDTVTLNKIKVSVCTLSSSDAIEILEHARREGVRLKRSTLVKRLEQDKTALQSNK